MSEHDDLLDPGVRDTGSSVVGAKIPNANAILTLGILSIVGCGLYILPGLICGIIALSLFPKAKKTYLKDPSRFEDSFKNAKGGFVCAIIGTSLAALFFLFFIVAFIVSVSMFSRS
jgi:predicted RND superfamily exporter protein